LNEDNIQSKSDEQKSCCQTEREKKEEAPDPMEEILKLSKF
jgi:hypothetical protein